MSDSAGTTPPQTGSSAPKPRRSCAGSLGGFFVWLLTLLLAVALSLAAAAAIAYYGFGYRQDTLAQLGRAGSDLEALRRQNNTLQTQVAQIEVRESSARETLDDVNRQIGEIQQQATALAGLEGNLRESIALAATLQATAREDRTTIAVFATTQAANAVRLADVEQRSERIARFLQRLGDIAGDTAADLNVSGPAATPTPAANATPPPVSTPTVTPASTTTSALTTTPAPTP